MKYTKLWLLVLLFAGADIATTVYGLHNGETEGNPVAQDAIEEIGLLPALAGVKFAAISIALICQHMMDSHEWVPSVCLMLVWGPVVVWNLTVIVP